MANFRNCPHSDSPCSNEFVPAVLRANYWPRACKEVPLPPCSYLGHGEPCKTCGPSIGAGVKGCGEMCEFQAGREPFPVIEPLPRGTEHIRPVYGLEDEGGEHEAL